jgi:hypothetical protein
VLSRGGGVDSMSPMWTRPRNFGWVLVGTLVIVALLAVPALAQQAQPVGPPQAPSPGTPPKPPTIMMYLSLALIVAAVAFAAAFPVKRGHQD